jgi:hypothetical protein
MAQIEINIDKWKAWAPGLASEADWRAWAEGAQVPPGNAVPDVSSIAPMLRRRLGVLGKMVFSVAMPLLEEPATTPLLFCSRHGEQDITIGLLQSLADAQPLSPAAFSLSVHNAIGGLFSIAGHCTAPISALAADEHLISCALTEAAAQLADSEAEQLLVVIYDLPLPNIYFSSAERETNSRAKAPPVALALRLSKQGKTTLSACLSAKSGPLSAHDTLDWLRWYVSGAHSLTLHGRRNSWVWSRC